ECLAHDFDKVMNHRAWMTRICSNKSLDLLKSAHKNRNKYIGIWLPDMIPDTLKPQQLEDSNFELAETITISFLLLLQTLRPVERAVFLLKDVFGYSFNDISQLLGKSKLACRKIAERARISISDKNHIFLKPSIDAEKLIRQFFEAARTGDQHQLEALLSEKSEFLADGGGKVPAAPMISTKEKIVDFFMSLQKSPIFSPQGYRIETTWINSRPGIIISKLVNENFWQFETVISFEIQELQIVRIFAQRNPQKLKGIESLISKELNYTKSKTKHNSL
ncbi:MAG: sigma factor-like helix-turn-helix DNA-binding protein, partial [Ginsengibacter sp.]